MDLWKYRGIHFLLLKFYIQYKCFPFPGTRSKIPLKLMEIASYPMEEKEKKRKMFCMSKYQKYQSELTKYNLTCSVLYFFSFRFLYLTPYADVQFHWCNYHYTLVVFVMFKHAGLVGCNLVMKSLMQQSPKALMPLLPHLNLDLNT